MNFRGEVVTPRFLEVLEAEDYLLLAAVLIMPWLFGGVEIWAFRFGSLLLVAAAAAAMAKHGWQGLGLKRGRAIVLPALLLAGWAAFQVVPLPPAVIGLLSPTANSIYEDTFPGYPNPDAEVVAGLERSALAMVPEAEGIPAPPREETFFGETLRGNWTGWRTLSLLPKAGIERLCWYLALLFAFLVACKRMEDPERAHMYRNALFGLFAALALFALVQAATYNGMMYWVRPLRDSNARPFGPYVNPTNFAAVMELAVPWLIGYGILVLRRTGGGVMGLLRSPIFAVGALLCLSAGIAAASKVAALLMLVSMTVVLLIGTRRKSYRFAILFASIATLAGAGLLLQSTRLGERVQEFLQSTPNLEAVNRVVAVKSAVPMFRDFMMVGSGFGSFREVFSRYQPAGEFLVWNQLHNDYFEVLIEGGLVAGILLLWLMVAFWGRVLARDAWKHSRGRVDLEHLGILVGLGALSLHAFVDFNHQIPANALLFVTLGAFAATSRTRSRAAGGA
jgi:hypothetical protein